MRLVAGRHARDGGMSCSITITCAPLSSLTRASPSIWSPWAWLPSRIFVSVNLKPELFDRGFYLRHGVVEIAVDEDVSGGGCDQE